MARKKTFRGDVEIPAGKNLILGGNVQNLGKVAVSEVDIIDGNLDGDNVLEITIENYFPGRGDASLVLVNITYEEVNGAGSVLLKANLYGSTFTPILRFAANDSGHWLGCLPIYGGKVKIQRSTLGGAGSSIVMSPIVFL